MRSIANALIVIGFLIAIVWGAAVGGDHPDLSFIYNDHVGLTIIGVFIAVLFVVLLGMGAMFKWHEPNDA